MIHIRAAAGSMPLNPSGLHKRARPYTRVGHYDVRERVGVVAALFGFLWRQKAWWLFPAMLALLMIIGLVALGAATPLAPFIYPLF
jgi:hypothetical protein